MSLDPLLLNLLACPIDKQALLYLAEDDVLYNPRLRRLLPRPRRHPGHARRPRRDGERRAAPRPAPPGRRRTAR